MSRYVIDLFMFAYQVSFRESIQFLARGVLKELGADVEATCLLVGVRRPGRPESHPVCIEPEMGRWKLQLFDGLLEAVEDIYSTHSLQKIIYGDGPSNRDKPEVMRRESVTTAVRRAIRSFDVEHGVRSFCGMAMPVGEYHVVPIIQVPESLFEQFPQLNLRPPNEWKQVGFRSLIDAALASVLKEATSELERPEPGRFMTDGIRRPDEIVRVAAKQFLETPGIAFTPRHISTDLFSKLNLVSSLLYEGAKGTGRLLLANPENSRIEYLLRFRKPVPFDQPRWSRKVLELASPDVQLIADSQYIYGLGRLNATCDHKDQDVFMVEFLDHYTWELRCDELPLLRCEYGTPSLPQEPLDRDTLISSLKRMFPSSTKVSREQIWELFLTAARQGRGTMIVVAEDAQAESERLSSQGSGIVPVNLSSDLFQRVSSIDGTVLLDPKGFCHAVGVILDGPANDDCSPSRGSRFNSAVRYVRNAVTPRLAIVVSDDRTVDVFPKLLPRVSQLHITSHLLEFLTSDVDSYHSSMNWLDKRRFYLDAKQCQQVNARLQYLDQVPREATEFRYLVNSFSEDPGFDTSYLSP